jgi:hypothetical protein
MRTGILPDGIAASCRLASVIAGLSLALGGCATTTPESAQPTTAAPAVAGNDVQCTNEKPTGSMLPVKVCTTKAQRGEIDSNTRATRDQIQRAHSPACPGTPGCATH